MSKVIREPIHIQTADKMFEELGYKKEEDIENMYFNVEIPFKKQKNIKFENINSKHVEICMSEYDEFGDLKFNKIGFTMQELQAINEKCKELRLVRKEII